MTYRRPASLHLRLLHGGAAEERLAVGGPRRVVGRGQSRAANAAPRPSLATRGRRAIQTPLMQCIPFVNFHTSVTVRHQNDSTAYRRG